MSVNKQTTYIRAAYAGQVYSRQFVTAGEVYKTPSEWRGRIVRFYAVDGHGRLMFGETDQIAIDSEAVSELDEDGNLLANDQTCPKNLKDWSFTDIMISKNSTDHYFTVKGDEDGIGYWYAHLADWGKSVI